MEKNKAINSMMAPAAGFLPTTPRPFIQPTEIVEIPKAWIIHTRNWKKNMKKNTKKLNELSLLKAL